MVTQMKFLNKNPGWCRGLGYALCMARSMDALRSAWDARETDLNNVPLLYCYVRTRTSIHIIYTYIYIYIYIYIYLIYIYIYTYRKDPVSSCQCCILVPPTPRLIRRARVLKKNIYIYMCVFMDTHM